MNVYQIIWLSIAIFAAIMFVVKLAAEGDMLDIFSLVVLCIYIGWAIGHGP